MNTSKTNDSSRKQTALAVFDLAWTPIAERLDAAEDADAQFDGGEWSGAACAEFYESHLTICIVDVARDLGIDAITLANWITERDNEQPQTEAAQS